MRPSFQNVPAPQRLVAILNPGGTAAANDFSDSRPLVGILEGAGVGPTVVGAALEVLQAVERVLPFRCEVRHGGLIGDDAIKECGQWLPEATVEFCADIFRGGGAILSGPGGGRYVYDLRRRFDLFCKFVPIRPVPELVGASRLHAQRLKDVDIVIVRENTGGVYQGRWGDRATPRGRVAEHSFSYSETEVRRILEVAARAARARRGDLCVVVKEGGIPSITALWRDLGASVAQRHGLEARFMNVDLAAYELIQKPTGFDVIVAPNLFGDILADVGGLLMGSRGLTFSGNFDADGHGVYQTNHGCAHDLAGTDMANPAGQIFSLAMMLRESFGLIEAAAFVEAALAETWRQGWRTADVAEPGCGLLGTRGMAAKVAEQVLRLAETGPLA